MELSRRCKDFWGFGPRTEPFGNRIESDQALFVWPEFERVVTRLIDAVLHRQFLCLVGATCSAKTTAWLEARRRLVATHGRKVAFAKPHGIEPSRYNEQDIYRVIKYALEPVIEGDRATALARSREDRCLQCRRLLEESNGSGSPVCLVVDEAHAVSLQFLLCCRRMWDDLYGFDRLLSLVLIGQPPLMERVSRCAEIDQRAELDVIGGLGNSLGDYLGHECARCGLTASPFDASAIEALGVLHDKDAMHTRDHPLIVNNIVSEALMAAWRIKQQVVTRDQIDAAIRVAAVGGRS